MITVDSSRRAARVFILIVGVLAACPAALAADGPATQPAAFRAGYAHRDVTPAEPVPMWGYAGRKAALSQGSFDPLYADALVVAAGEQKLAIVGLDLGRAPGEQTLANVRRRIKEGAGIEQSLIAGSHTHHGPVLELTDAPGKGRGRYDAALRYYTHLENEIVAAILEADRNLAAATLATGSARLEGFNRNRHSKRPEPPVDRELGVMRFDRAADGKPIAVLVNFAAHPTLVSAAGLRFSADWVGVMKRDVAKGLACGVVFMPGAGGDLSPDSNAGRGHERFGAAMAREVVRVAGELKPSPVARPSLDVREERLTFKSRTDFGNPGVTVMYGLAFFPELVANYLDEYRDGVRPRLTVVLLNGDVALVGASGEFFAAHAMRLRERTRGVKQLYFFGYCNGYHQYFPTIEAAAEGGYGADRLVSPVEVGAGERVMDTALIRLYQMTGRL